MYFDIVFVLYYHINLMAFIWQRL